MKEILEKHEEELTPEENSRVWAVLYTKIRERRSSPRMKWIPIAASVLVIGSVVVVLRWTGEPEYGADGSPNATSISRRPLVTTPSKRQSSKPPVVSGVESRALNLPYLAPGHVAGPVPKTTPGYSEPPLQSSEGGILSAPGEVGFALLQRGNFDDKSLSRLSAEGWQGIPRPISVGGTDPVNGESFDAMFFEHYGVNPFVDPEEDRFATFAVDVDNASYALARAYLDRGELPPKDAIRVEEFVNAFRHAYEPPAPRDRADREPAAGGEDAFAIHLEAAPSPFGANLTLLRVGLKGREVAIENRKPAILTFIVDVSGSMQQENRLELVKKSLRLLLDEMNDDDRVGLVVYGSDSRTILTHRSLEDRREIESAIERLIPEGSTNAEAGLIEGYRLADQAFRKGCINRVILCSDGVANVGRTGAEDILQRIHEEARRGIELSAIGFGMGNYNDVLMEKLADRGDGNYYYVDDLSEARRVFVESLTSTLQTIARQVKIQVEFNPNTVRRYRLLGYENRDVADRDFRNDRVDAGEVGAGHEVTALFEVRAISREASDSLATVRIRYEDPESGVVREEARSLRIGDIRGEAGEIEPSFRVDAAVAEFAEILRHSYWAREGNLASVETLLRDVGESMESRSDLEELRRLVREAETLWPKDEAGRPAVDSVRPKWDPDRE